MTAAKGPKAWQVLKAIGLALAFGLGAGAVQAQTAAPPAGVLTLNQERLINESAYGREIAGKIDEAARALQAENRKLDKELEAEEKALTDERARLSPEAFRQKAEAFDAKVEKIRAEQDAKGRALSDEREAARLKILQTAAPILAKIMAERGAVAILDRSQVVVSFDQADITSEAITRLDAALAGKAEPEAAAPQPPAPPAPAPPAAAPTPQAAPMPEAPPAPEAALAPEATPMPEAAPAPVTAPAPEALVAPLPPSDLALKLKGRPAPAANPKIDYKALALAARGPRPRANPKTQGP